MRSRIQVRFYNMYRNRTQRYNCMQRNCIHCDDLGMHQLLDRPPNKYRLTARY